MGVIEEHDVFRVIQSVLPLAISGDQNDCCAQHPLLVSYITPHTASNTYAAGIES